MQLGEEGGRWEGRGGRRGLVAANHGGRGSAEATHLEKNGLITGVSFKSLESCLDGAAGLEKVRAYVLWARVGVWAAAGDG